MQSRIIELLGPHSELYLGLENKIDDQSRDRERCYFNVGYEYGAAAARASLRQAPKRSQKRADLLVADLRSKIAQHGTPAEEAMAALLLCALALVESQGRGGVR